MVHIYSNPACLTLPIDHVTSLNSLPCQYVKKKKKKANTGFSVMLGAWHGSNREHCAVGYGGNWEMCTSDNCPVAYGDF